MSPVRLVITALLTLITFDRWTVYNTPLTGIDGSWAIGLHLARQAGLEYGTDFVFTYGPLGWLTSRLPIDAEVWPLVLFDVVFIIHMGAILWVAVGKRLHWPRMVLLTGLVVTHRLTAGTELPFVFYFFTLAYLAWHRRTANPWALMGASVMAVFTFYLKANVGLIGVCSVAFYAMAQGVLGQLPILSSLLTLAGLSGLVALSAWALPVQLVPYLQAQWHLIDSFNDVMYLSDSSRMTKISLLLVLASGVWLSWQMGRLVRSRSLLEVLRRDGVLLSLVGLQVFVLFKEGFVRGDVGHIGLFYKYALLPLSVVVLFAQTNLFRQWALLTAVALALLAP